MPQVVQHLRNLRDYIPLHIRSGLEAQIGAVFIGTPDGQDLAEGELMAAVRCKYMSEHQGVEF